jgi:DnaJ-class molecular chaperone
MRMTPHELALAKQAAIKLRRTQAELHSAPCLTCRGQGQVESGIAILGPESKGDGHACFAPCPDCAGTGKEAT